MLLTRTKISAYPWCSSGTNAFRYPFAWGLDTPEMTDVEVDNKKTTDVQKKVKEVKRLQEQSDKTKETPMRGRRLSLFPLPYDHLDDIFLSSAGVDQ